MTKISDETLLAFNRIGALLRYEPDTGMLFWLSRAGVTRAERIFNTRFAGLRAGCAHSEGCRSVYVLGQRLLEHRVAFLLVKRRWPFEIDHINGQRSDNRWLNLREVSRLENNRNMALPSHNTSGVVGVAFVERLSKWRAELSVKGKTVVLGHFATKEQAVSARASADKTYGFSERHGSRA